MTSKESCLLGFTFSVTMSLLELMNMHRPHMGNGCLDGKNQECAGYWK